MDKHFLNGRKDGGWEMSKKNNVMMSLSVEKELQNINTENTDILICGDSSVVIDPIMLCFYRYLDTAMCHSSF